MHARNHIFYEIRIPTYAMNNLTQVSEVAYAGRVDLRNSPVLTGELCGGLVEKSGMEKSEVEGLFEQFVCLASARREDDPLGWAVDRATFPHIISPLSSYAPLRMNLVFDRLFDLFDTNRDGLVDFEEFVMGVVFLRNRNGISKRERWKKTFRAYDIDGDGYVTRKDCLRMFRALYTIQRDLALDLLTQNEAVNALRDASHFAASGRVISAAFTQNPRTVPNAREPLGKSRNSYSEIRHQPEQDVVRPNGDLSGDPEEILGHAWESAAQFPFDTRTGEPLSLRDFLYLAPRDQSGQAPSHIARDQRVHFAYDGQPLREARTAAVKERRERVEFYGYEIEERTRDYTRDVSLQVLETALNELLDPMFKEKEDLHVEAISAKPEIQRFKDDIDAFVKRKEDEREAAERAKGDPLMMTALAAEEAAKREKERQQEEKAEMERQAHGVNGYARGAVTMDEVITNVEAGIAQQPLGELLESEGFGIRDELANLGASAGIDSAEARTATHLDISTAPPPQQPSPVDESRTMQLMPSPSLRNGTSFPFASVPSNPAASSTLGNPSATTASSSTIPAEQNLVTYRDPTMPQFRPNSSLDISTSSKSSTATATADNAPKDVTVDPLRLPYSVLAGGGEGEGHRPKFEAEIIRQFEAMFLGWERDPVTGLVVNSVVRADEAKKRVTKGGEEKPTEERVERLIVLRTYLGSEMGKRKTPGMDFEEFLGFVGDVSRKGGVGQEMKFLEGWLEVCFF